MEEYIEALIVLLIILRHLNDLINMAGSLKFDFTVIVGDFNYPHVSWEDWTTPNNPNNLDFLFMECLRDNYLDQCISQPTRYREQTYWILFIIDKSEIVTQNDLQLKFGSR